MSTKSNNRLLFGPWLIAAALAAAGTGASRPALADILDGDEDEPPPVKSPPPAKGDKRPPQAAPSKGGKNPAPAAPERGDNDEGSDEAPSTKPAPRIDTTSDSDRPPGIKEPTAHDKSPASSTSTTVIGPKNPGKPAKAKPGKGGKQAPQEPVHFRSEGFKGLREKGVVEFIHNVVVTQGDMKLESDHANAIFDEASHEVRKVVAEGNVRINGIDENSGDHFKAFGDKAVFLNAERTVVLEGNAKLQRGDDSVIRSRKITYEMNTGWIRADRVEGEVQADANKPAPSPKSAKGKGAKAAEGGSKSAQVGPPSPAAAGGKSQDKEKDKDAPSSSAAPASEAKPKAAAGRDKPATSLKADVGEDIP